VILVYLVLWLKRNVMSFLEAYLVPSFRSSHWRWPVNFTLFSFQFRLVSCCERLEVPFSRYCLETIDALNRLWITLQKRRIVLNAQLTVERAFLASSSALCLLGVLHEGGFMLHIWLLILHYAMLASIIPGFQRSNDSGDSWTLHVIE